ncbi:MAG: methyl-accepting chemotaxis protein [Phycisphaeraceae bacterium]
MGQLSKNVGRSLQFLLFGLVILITGSPLWAATNLTENKTLDLYKAELGATGQFIAPTLEVVQREAFGIAAAATQSPALEVAESGGFNAVFLAWVLTLLTVAATLFAAWYLSTYTDTDGNRHRGWTLGSKLSLSLGSLTILLMVVTSITLTSLAAYEVNDKQFQRLSKNALTMNHIETELQQMRLASNKFLRENNQESLLQFTTAIGNVLNYIDEVRPHLSAEEIESLDLIQQKIQAYDRGVSEVVIAIDQRNGILHSQLNITGPRLVELLMAVKKTAWADNDPPAALVAAETLNELSLARVSVMRYLRTYAEKDVADAIARLSNAAKATTDLSTELQNPVRRARLAEIESGFAFYTERLNTMRGHIADRERIVDEQLDVYGPQIAKAGEALIASVEQKQATLASNNDTLRAWITMVTLIAGTISLILAFSITFILVRGINLIANKVLGAMNAVADGNLSVPLLNAKGSDELASLARATDRMNTSLRDVIQQVRDSASSVTQGATQIAAASEEISSGMTDQSAQVTQVSAAIEEMSSSIIEVARKSADASNAASDAGSVADSGGKIVRETVEGMNAINNAVIDSSRSVAELGKRGEQIGEIISVINDIADQTNLLALNAAIEAARAGEHGRGFAVVADEVRKLADRTTKATEEIAESIEAIQTETGSAVSKMERGTEQVARGVEQATSAGKSLEQIVVSTRDVASMIQSIAAAAEEQSSASEQVSRSISSIQVITEESTKGAQSAAQAATSLADKAERLNQLVARFKLDKTD